MKYQILIVISLFTSSLSSAQEIEKIVVMNQETDEPPTKEGQPQYSITFTKNEKGEFESKKFSINGKRKKLQKSVIIEKSRIDTYNEWTNKSKNIFLISELGLKYDNLRIKQKNSSYNLKLGFPNELIIKVDSFEFCQKYKMTKSISTGGYSILLTIIDDRKNEQKITFNSDDFSQGIFALKEYIYFFQLLNNCIPEEFPNHDFFSRKNLIENILKYQQTVECEGFYFAQFIKEHPERTKRENRMMTGWDFNEYFKKIRPADNNGEHP